MKVAYVVYPDFTALDLVGPYEVISRWPDVEVHFVASSSGAVRTDCGLTVLPTDTPETLPDPDLIVVPGSGNPLPVLGDEALLAWLSRAAPKCQWTVSVCTGASLYAAAGLLHDKKTTTHWAFRDVVRGLGAQVVEDRVVWQGNHISGAGVSAGIDVALALTERSTGKSWPRHCSWSSSTTPSRHLTPARRRRPTVRQSGWPARSCWPGSRG